VRSTHDIDARNKNEATVKMLSVYHNIKYAYPDADIRVDLTRKGYHLVVWIKRLKQKEALAFRATFGDDNIRLMLDSSRSNDLTKNVLWTEKKGWKVRKDIDPYGDNHPFSFSNMRLN